MRVGYCVPIAPVLASFRLRVALPAPHTGLDYIIGNSGDVTFFFKDGDPNRAGLLPNVVFDVVNDHFDRPNYGLMCSIANKVTCASEEMARVIKVKTGKKAIVIDDPYEGPEKEPKCEGDKILWFGHGANASSLGPYVSTPNLYVCSNFNGTWSLENERAALHDAAIVLLTGNNKGASTNRMAKALRAGRFVVTPGGIPSWDRFSEFCWIGDVQEGINWALTHRDEACQKVRAGQEWIRDRYSPQKIGQDWAGVFR